MLGFRVNDTFTRPSSDLLAKFSAIPTAIISDNMHRLFAGGCALKPFHGRDVLCGPALTVRTRPGDNLMVHKAIDMAQPGDIIVVDASGDMTNAIIGEIMTTLAKKKGISGFVIDGAIRDHGAILDGGLPVYARGITHRGPYKDGPGEVGITVSVAGMVVQPGDIMVGDEDGILAIPLDHAEAILALAQDQQAREAAILQSIHDGTLDRGWVNQTLRAKGAIT